MMNKKVLIGISGGIDSAASLLLLQEKGYEVIGIHLDLFGEHRSEKEIHALSKRLHIPIYTLDRSARFNEEVIKWFIQEYMAGRTPSPCTRCNVTIKWRVLAEEADRLGCDWIATGHYCRITTINERLFIQKGIDPLKDQSYYLWELPQSLLSRILFPLGDYTKQEVRTFMEQRGEKSLTEKRESMGVCFLEGRGYEPFLRKRVANINQLDGGEIIDKEGRVIGKHNGYPFYTIAQKKGMGLPKGDCIIAVDPEKNQLIAGRTDELFSKTIWIKEWITPDIESLLASHTIYIKVRGVGFNPSGYCSVTLEGDLLRIELDEAAWAVTKGQPIVFYEADRVVGGGIVADFL